MKVIAIIERNESGFYSIYAEDELPGIGLNGQGYSVEESKVEMMKALDDYKTMCREEGVVIPAEISDLMFDYKYDLRS